MSEATEFIAFANADRANSPAYNLAKLRNICNEHQKR